MNLVDVNPFDELVVLINNLSDEKSKRILFDLRWEINENISRCIDIFS